eukprot:COSAG04_NODE_372_length_15668_cov_11.135975_7_plen_129_part_00
MYLEFVSQPFDTGMFLRQNASETCGPPPPTPPTPSAACARLLDEHCPKARYEKMGAAGMGACQRCVGALKLMGKLDCGFMWPYEPQLWCSFYDPVFHKNYLPFEPPRESLATCFAPNVSRKPLSTAAF